MHHQLRRIGYRAENPSIGRYVFEGLRKNGQHALLVSKSNTVYFNYVFADSRSRFGENTRYVHMVENGQTTLQVVTKDQKANPNGCEWRLIPAIHVFDTCAQSETTGFLLL